MAKPLIRVASKVTLNLDKVQKASERSERKYLFRVGGYALKVAKSNVKTKKTSYSTAPDSPHGKTGAMRNGMAFDASMKTRDVVIGPARDSSKENSLVLHEYGGSRSGAKAGYRLVPTKSIRQGDIDPEYPVQPSRVRGHKRVFMPAGRRVYKPRPYMAPALKTTLDQDQTRFWIGA